MIAISTSRQFLGFTIGAGSGDQIEYSVHYDGLAQRRVGRSGGSTTSAVKTAGMNGFSGRLDFATSTEVLQGPVTSQSGAITIHTITVANPGGAAVDVEIYMREDSSPDDTLPPTQVRNRLWVFTLQPGETWAYANGSGAMITPGADSGSAPNPPEFGELSGITDNVPFLVTATTAGTAHVIHTAAADELINLEAGSTTAATNDLSVRIGGALAPVFLVATSKRGPVVILEDYKIASGQTIEVWAAIASETCVWGRRRQQVSL